MKEMLKRILIFSVIMSAAFFFAGCNKTEDSQETTDSGSNNAEKKMVLRLSSNVGKREIDENKTGMARGLNAWIETVEKESGGTIEINLFTDAQLAKNTDEIVNGIQSGGFEVAHFATGNWAEYTNAFAELNVPYLYSTFEDVHKVMDSEIGENMMKKLEEDVPSVKALAYIDIGFRDITNSKKTIRTPDDMKGLKIRTMNDKLQMEAMKYLGASVTPMSFSELYSALQQGLVDAQENPLSTIYTNKFYEVNKYCTLTNHSFTSTFMFMNRKIYDGLSERQGAAIDAANKACMKASREAADSVEREYISLLEEAGVEIYKPTPDEMAKFRKAASNSWVIAEALIGTDRYNALMKTLGIE